MKKFIISILAVAMIFSVFSFTACNGGVNDDAVQNTQQPADKDGEQGSSGEQIKDKDDEKKPDGETPENYGKLYYLENAYEAGKITKDDLRSIAYYYNSEKVLPPDILDKETERKIQNCWKEMRYNSESIDASKVSVRYYGTYGGYKAVEISASCTNGGGDPIIIEKYEIDGVTFTNYFSVCLWEEPEKEETPENYGKLYYLKNAYEDRKITKDDLRSIAYYYNSEDKREENFIPPAETKQTISKETENKIVSDFCNKFKMEGYKIKETYFKYFGTYNSLIAVDVDIIYTVDVCGEPHDVYKIDGVSFYDYSGVWLWQEN